MKKIIFCLYVVSSTMAFANTNENALTTLLKQPTSTLVKNNNVNLQLATALALVLAHKENERLKVTHECTNLEHPSEAFTQACTVVFTKILPNCILNTCGEFSMGISTFRFTRSLQNARFVVISEIDLERTLR